MKYRTIALAAFAFAAAALPVTAAQYSAVIVPNTPLPIFCAGKTSKVTVSLGNSGAGAAATWTASLTHLRYHWKQGGVIVVYDGLKTSLPGDVPAGGQVSVAATVQAPGAPGTWELIFDMATDGVGWFEWFGSKTWSQAVTVLTPLECVSNASMIRGFGPTITKCSSFTKPGFFVLCEGKDFGVTPGKILIKGIPGNPDQELWAGPGAWGSRTWTDTGIFVNVPKDLAGFRSTQVKIEVVNSLNHRSNDVAMRIDPLLDYALVWDGISVNGCQAAGDQCVTGYTWAQPTPVKVSIYGKKWPKNHGSVYASGTDSYSVAVGTDFVLDRYELCGEENFGCLPNARVSKFPDGATSASFNVDWNTNFWGDEMLYFIFVYAYGPRGISPK